MKTKIVKTLTLKDIGDSLGIDYSSETVKELECGTLLKVFIYLCKKFKFNQKEQLKILKCTKNTWGKIQKEPTLLVNKKRVKGQMKLLIDVAEALHQLYPYNPDLKWSFFSHKRSFFHHLTPMEYMTIKKLDFKFIHNFLLEELEL